MMSRQERHIQGGWEAEPADAVDRYLGLTAAVTASSRLDELIATGTVRPPRSPYRKSHRRLRLPPGVTTADLLDREDRL